MSGLFLMALGVCAILLAIGLFGYNQMVQKTAEKMNRKVLTKMQSIEPELTMHDMQNDENAEMPEVEIDGERYIGQLKIPDLGLELPVISQWSYPSLKKAPCRYSGTIANGDLVLLGHSYKKHFGNLKNLKNGSQIEFQDIRGNQQKYEVAVIETIKPTDVEKVVAGEYALTLFTCTYSGQYRTMVGCRYTESE